MKDYQRTSERSERVNEGLPNYLAGHASVWVWLRVISLSKFSNIPHLRPSISFNIAFAHNYILIIIYVANNLQLVSAQSKIPFEKCRVLARSLKARSLW